jgi:CheY-like chemotaxis protein
MVSYISRCSSRSYSDNCIIIDVLSNRKMLNLILKNKGIESIVQAVDGQNAIEVVEQYGINYFHIIFMDSVMPNLCGPEAARKLRDMRYSHLLLGLTGNALQADVEAFEAAGADAVLIKPLNQKFLMKLLTFATTEGFESNHNLLLSNSTTTSIKDHHMDQQVVDVETSMNVANSLKSFIFS